MNMQKVLLITGAAILILGLCWPWLSRLPLGRLPGDILISRPGFKFYCPITSMLIISLLISIILWVLRR